MTDKYRVRPSLGAMIARALKARGYNSAHFTKRVGASWVQADVLDAEAVRIIRDIDPDAHPLP